MDIEITERELQCLQARMDHGSSKAAAAALFISGSTYKNYLNSINKKIGTHDITAAIAYAWRRRWVW
ncbi:MAG: response regulator transcription factor [Planctomycetota bacterium]|jgi:DNA-binding CsgD family transcriptional regulator